MKVVIFAHAHPTFSKGGGELAAYYLWQGINEHPEHEAWFIGRADQRVMHKFSSLAAIGERDYLMAGNAGIPDLMSSNDLGPDNDLAQFLERVQPDVVHFHHYVHIGIETIRLVKRVCPGARIVVTLHEYIAICMNNGQMVKTDGRLCYQSSPRECHLCFPHMSQEDFFLRERWIKSFFGLVDLFISPSHFLRERYVAWGIEPDRITVIENGLPEGEPVPPRELAEGEQRTRFAYFGQINPYKGVDIILEAFARLPKKLRKQVTLDIFGSALDQQTPEFQEKVYGLLSKLKGTVHLHGPYEPHEMGRLMAEVDWVVMGSIWWENSPLVIQEAFKFGRPIIVPDIGGMAEKVKPGKGGLNYRNHDSVSLAALLTNALSSANKFNELYQTIPLYSSVEQITERHTAIYKNLRGALDG
ncbi:glycosyltransferase family 4 protein [Aquibaculum sediminis]|uniref:glycosyltransferase family 4 protein n=1 Tax=Aquibaculum sediminis TaxID=3231907 RepID=UPI0034548B02